MARRNGSKGCRRMSLCSHMCCFASAPPPLGWKDQHPVSAKTIRLAQAFAFRHNCLCCVLEQPFVPDAAKVWFEPSLPNAVPQHFASAENPACCSRPKPAIHRLFEMLQRSPSLQTFVHRAAFSRLKGRSADKVSFRCICANVRSGEPFNKRSIPPVTETSEF